MIKIKTEKINTQDLSYAAFFAALTSILSYISIPIGPVPITGQSLAVILAGITLTTKQAALAMGGFILLGLIGLPVFAGGSAGFGVLFGPTGGYIVGYFFGAITISLLKKKDNYPRLILAVIIGGFVVLHFLGVIWLSYITETGLKEAFSMGTLPFIAGDIVKMILAVIIGVKINKHRNRLSPISVNSNQ